MKRELETVESTRHLIKCGDRMWTLTSSHQPLPGTKELIKNVKPSSTMTQWFLVMAKKPYNEERKPVVTVDLP